MTTWAVLMTCHDRRDATLSCLSALEDQEGDIPRLQVHLVDAGSRDGTAAAVRDRFPDVEVFERSPDLFWNAGMRVAFARAHARDYDGYLWLNDDTVLDRDAVARLEQTADRLRREGRWPAIVVGATRDPTTGEVTYGGVERPDRVRRLRWTRVPPGGEPRPVETMNGNCVLVPREVAEAVGNLDARFTHGLGDYDYGLRARRKGFPAMLAPRPVGTCAPNPRRELPTVGANWHDAVSIKGLPPREWATFARRWAGPAWPLYFLSPYLRQLAAEARRRVPGAG